MISRQNTLDSYQRPSGLILAAGLSSRMGSFKPLLPFKGTTLIKSVVSSFLQVCKEVFVVVGYEREKVERELAGLTNVSIIYNKDYEKGMYTSFLCGLTCLKEKDILLGLGDMPFISSSTLEKMATIKRGIAIPTYKKERGHPVLISKENVDIALSKQDSFTSPRELIDSLSPKYIEVNDPGILKDIDTPKDLVSLGFSSEDPLDLRESKFLGASLNDKCSGEAHFTEDLNIPNLNYVKVVRSPISKGKLLSLRWGDLPHGYRVITYKDIPGKNYVTDLNEDWIFLIEEQIESRGDALCLVAGPDLEVCNKIAKSIAIEVKEETPNFEMRKGRILASRETKKGDLKVFSDPKYRKFSRTYRTGEQEHLYLEPQSALCDYHPNDGTIDIFASIQCAYYPNDAVSVLLDLPKDKIRTSQCTTGGGFGGKEDYPQFVIDCAALASFILHKPVRLLYEREEDILYSSKRHPSESRIDGYLDNQGKLIGLDIEINMNAGAYTTITPLVLNRAVFSAGGVYNIPNIRVKGTAWQTNLCPFGAFRGFGGPQGFFPIEMFMDSLAKSFHLDPLDFKKSYFVHQGDITQHGGKFFAPILLDEMLERLLKASNYQKEKETWVSDDKYFRGIGVSIVYHGTGLVEQNDVRFYKPEILVKKEKDHVKVYCTAIDMGQGIGMALSKIAARTLNIPLENVEMHNYSTKESPDSGPTVASRSVFVVGRMVKEACIFLKDVECGEKRQGYSLPDYLKWDSNTCEGNPFSDYSWAINMAFVEVDRLSYDVKVKRLETCYEVGRVVNEEAIFGQVEGGSLQGIGLSTIEEIHYKDGQIIQSNLTNYAIPSIYEAPEVHTIFVENEEVDPDFPAKGIGELTLVGLPPAVGIAVENAIGGEVEQIPLSPEYLMRKLS